MMELNLPEWLSIGTLGATASAILGVIFMFVKISSTAKANKQNGLAQINLLETMTNKLSDMKVVADKLATITDAIDTVKLDVETMHTDNDNVSIALATFVNTCFQESNLSEEKKIKLNLKLQELFAEDKDTFIHQLETINEEITKDKTKADETIEQLQKDLENAKAAIPPKVTKQRRV